MSVVTNVVVHVYDAPTEVSAALVEPLPFHIIGQALLRINPANSGGTKVMESDVYVAAFNYLDIDAFLGWFRALPWDYASKATLSLYDELEEHCLIRLAQGSWKEVA